MVYRFKELHKYICQKCGEEEEFIIDKERGNPTVKAHNERARLEKKGWENPSEDVHYCPECSNK